MNWDKVTPIQANTLSLGKSAFELRFSCQQRHYFRLSLPAPLRPAQEEDGSAVLPRALHTASTPWAFTRVRGRFNLLPPIPIFWIWTVVTQQVAASELLLLCRKSSPGCLQPCPGHCFQPVPSGTEGWRVSEQKRTVALSPPHPLSLGFITVAHN